MKLFYAPRSCSIGIHVILEELGVSYEQERVDLSKREQRAPRYLAINPKGKVPALLRDDGTVLTEFQSIAFWLAKAFPGGKLLPPSVEGEVRTLEFLDFAVGTVHMRSFALAMMPQKITASEACQTEIRAYGKQGLADGFEQISRTLGGEQYMMGDYSIADAAGYYLVAWAERQGIPLPENLSAYLDRLAGRPAIQAALARQVVD